MGRDQGVLLEISVGSDMVKMFMGIYYNVDIPDLDSNGKKRLPEIRKVFVGSGIDKNIFIITPQQICVTAGILSFDEKNIRM